MTVSQWVFAILLGGMLGMIGQGIRVIAGLKKVNDQAMEEGKSFGSLFQGTTLGISLLIGFVAGALAIIVVSGVKDIGHPTKELILSVIGAGYAGTDFIEGLIKKNMPAAKGAAPANEGAKENDLKPAME